RFGAYAQYVCLLDGGRFMPTDSLIAPKPRNISDAEAATVPTRATLAMDPRRAASAIVTVLERTAECRIVDPFLRDLLRLVAPLGKDRVFGAAKDVEQAGELVAGAQMTQLHDRCDCRRRNDYERRNRSGRAHDLKRHNFSRCGSSGL
ncbi:MAG TPA: hypothetical protein VFF60_03265, partial [Candidatus Binatus sp.]|nr:hypothetical protein [Candidatus Binatus sp.]